MSIIESNADNSTETPSSEVESSEVSTSPETDTGVDEVTEELPSDESDVENESGDSAPVDEADEALAAKMMGEFTGNGSDPFAAFESKKPEPKTETKPKADAKEQEAQEVPGFDLDALEQNDIVSLRDDLGDDAAAKFAKANRARTEAIIAQARNIAQETINAALGPILPSIRTAHQTAIAQQFRQIDESVDKWAGPNAHLVGTTTKQTKLQTYIRTAMVRKASAISQSAEINLEEAYPLALPAVLREMKAKGFKVGEVKNTNAAKASPTRPAGHMLAASAASTTKPGGRPGYNAKADALAAMRSVRAGSD